MISSCANGSTDIGMLLFVARAEEKSHTPLEKFWPETASSTFSKSGRAPCPVECFPVGA